MVRLLTFGFDVFCLDFSGFVLFGLFVFVDLIFDFCDLLWVCTVGFWVDWLTT